MSYTRSGTLFRTSSGGIPANQQEEFEHLSDSQSESISFVTARSSNIPFDNPPTYQEALFHQEFQQEVQQEVVHQDRVKFLYQTFINYEERIRSLEGSIQTSNNQIRSLENSVQTSNNQIT
ncbi:10024_t:CDS:2, partial [Gigaspora rosea]